MALAVILQTITFQTIAALRVNFFSIRANYSFNNWLKCFRIFFLNSCYGFLPQRTMLVVFTIKTITISTCLPLSQTLTVQFKTLRVSTVATLMHLCSLLLNWKLYSYIYRTSWSLLYLKESPIRKNNWSIQWQHLKRIKLSSRRRLLFLIICVEITRKYWRVICSVMIIVFSNILNRSLNTLNIRLSSGRY